MKRPIAIIYALAVLLVLSNALWAYLALGYRTSLSAREAALEDHRIALKQTLAILPVVSSTPAARTKVVATASSAANDPNSFEKSGFVWVGRIKLKFGPEGRLLEAAASWSPQ